MTMGPNSKDFFIGDKKVFGTENLYELYKISYMPLNGIKRYLIDVKTWHYRF